jgi:thioredoxin-like negative regulator of GroEL
MELGANNGQNAFTLDLARQSVDYWNNRAAQILSDSEASDSTSALKSYSHDTVAAANLLAAHDFGAEAEQAYRTATQFWPGNPESVNGLAELLLHNGRADEAEQIVNDFEQKYPDQRSTLERVRAGWRAVIGATQPPKP